VLGVRDCLLSGGPWCAAAAAYLDLFAPREEEGALLAGEEDERRRQVGAGAGAAVWPLTRRRAAPCTSRLA
jgi:hypothetical protein